MNSVLHYMINTILIALPEQFFISMMAIVMLKGMEVFQAGKNKKLILIILPALLANIPKLLNISDDISMVLGLIANTIIFTLLIRKHIFKVFLAVFASLVIYGGTEVMFVSMIMNSINMPLNDIQSNPVSTFLVSIPERVIQYGILYMTSFKKLKFLFKNRPVDVSLVSIIKVDKDLTRNAVIALAAAFVYILFSAKLIAIDGLFLSFNPTYALLSCSILFIVPFVILLAFSEVIVKNYINRLAVDMYEKEYQKSQKDKIKSKLVEMFDDANNGKDEKTMRLVAELMDTVNN